MFYYGRREGATLPVPRHEMRMVPVNDPEAEPQEGEGRRDELRSLVDLTIDPDEMIRVRDNLRTDLLHQYYALLMLARLQRKRGHLDEAVRLEERARESSILIWCLDNPMEALTWERSQD